MFSEFNKNKTLHQKERQTHRITNSLLFWDINHKNFLVFNKIYANILREDQKRILQISKPLMLLSF